MGNRFKISFSISKIFIEKPGPQTNLKLYNPFIILIDTKLHAQNQLYTSLSF